MLIPWTIPPALTAAATVGIDDDAGAWQGPIALLNRWSADDRMLVLADDAAVDIRPLPLPVTVQYQIAPRHDGAWVGLMTLDEVWRDGELLMGRGRIDMDDPQGAALARKIRGGFLRFVSADIDKVRGHHTCIADDGTPLGDCDALDSDLPSGEVYDQWRIMGASLLAHPAFPEASITLAPQSPQEETETVPVVGYDPAWGCVRPDGEGWQPADCDEDEAVRANADGTGPFTPEQPTAEPTLGYTADGDVPCTPREAPDAAAKACHDPSIRVDDGTTRAEAALMALAASAFAHPNFLPPTAAFCDPQLAQPTLINVSEPDADGYRTITGHLALWGVPHVSFQGRKVLAPTSPTGYERFHMRPIRTTEGLVEVGVLAMATTHAGTWVGADAAATHYDSTGAIVGAVRCGEDAFGIWMSGVLLPDIPPDQMLRLSLAAVSGDWRDEGHGLDLKAALAVPAGHEGFYTPKNAPPNRGDYALIASGAVTPAHIEQARHPSAEPSEALLEKITDRVTDRMSQQANARRRVAAAHMAVRAMRAAFAARQVYQPQVMAIATQAPLTGEEREFANALEDYWKTGEGAATIRWGTPGDWTRCHHHLTRHVGDDRASRICAQWHHDMTGLWPGDRTNP